MNKLIYLIFIFIVTSCSSYNKGIIAKKELRSKKPPSVKIAEEYDRKNKTKSKKNMNPKKAGKARDKQQRKIKKRGDKYLKKKRKKMS